MRSLRRCFTLLAIAALSSCGGGNSDSGTPQLSITAASPPVGTSGSAYPGYTFIASGGTAPLSWKELGALPPGVQLSTSGQLSGTPTIAGTYSISVVVT